MESARKSFLFVILLGLSFQQGNGATCKYQSTSISYYGMNTVTYSTPSYPTGDLGMDYCLIFGTSSNYRIRADVVASNTSGSSLAACSYYFELRDGDESSSSSNLLHRWCGTAVPKEIVSSQRYMTLRIQTSYSYSSYLKISFRAVLKSTCTTVTAYPGNNLITYITSPGYGSSFYESWLDRCWIIQAFSSSYKVRANVIDSQLEAATSCLGEDYVAVLDGKFWTSCLLQRWCGSTKPGYIYSSQGNILYIRFRTNGASNSYNGFKIAFTSVQRQGPTCTTITANLPSGTQAFIASPNYGSSSYSSCLEACWVIQAYSSNYRLEASVIASHVEYSITCLEDYVDVHDGSSSSSNLIARWCGSAKPSNIYSSGNYLYVRFITNMDENSYTGFKIKFTSLEPTSPTCATVKAYKSYRATTYITSPNYGSSYYSSNFDRCWTIQANSYYNKVKASVITSQMEYSSDCSGDYVVAHDGRYISSNLITKWCGSTNPGYIYSTGYYMFIRFKTNGVFNSYTGFKIAFIASSTGQPVVQTVAAQTMSVQTGSQPLAVSSTRPYIVESFTTTAKLPTANAQQPTMPSIFIPTIPTIPSISIPYPFSLGNLTTPKLVAGSGFCNYLQSEPFSQTLYSPGFHSPGFYSSYADECWVVRPEAAYSPTIIIISVRTMDLEYDPSCNKDYIEIHDGISVNSAILVRWCGTISAASVTSSGQHVYIRFKSNGSIQKKGFAIDFKDVGKNTSSKPVPVFMGSVFSGIIAIIISVYNGM